MAASSSDSSSSLPRWAQGLAIALGATAPFLSSLGHGFVYDDQGALHGNQVFQQPLHVWTLLTTDFWGNPLNSVVGSYRPLTVLTLWVDWHMGGGNPWVFHFTNVLLHLFASLVVYEVASNRFGEKISFPASVLFAVHPIHVENVAYIVGRADVLAALFGMLAWSAARAPSRLRLLCGPLLLAALLSKETAIAFFLLIGWDGLSVRREHSETPPRTALALALSLPLLVYVGLRHPSVQIASGGLARGLYMEVANPLTAAGLGTRIWTGVALLGKALGLLLAPALQSPDYSSPEILPSPGPWDPHVLAGILALGVLVVLAVGSRHRRSALGLGAAILLVGFAPVSNVALLIPTIFSERLLYLPSVGFCLMAGALAAAPQVKRLWPLVGGFAAALAVLSFNYTQAWASERALFEWAIRSTPNSSRAWMGLGNADLDEHDVSGAIGAFARAAELQPSWAVAVSNLGMAYGTAGRQEEAGHEFQRAVALDPTCRQCVANLFSYDLNVGRVEDARALVATCEGRFAEGPLLGQMKEALRSRGVAPALGMGR